MKKTISIILIVIVFFIVFFLQQNFFSWFTIAGISPNLFVILILFISLFIGKKYGIILGIIFGIYLDIVLNKVIGPTAFMFGIIALLGQYLEKSFTKDSRISLMFMVVVSTLVYEFGIYIFKAIKLKSYFEVLPFAKILLIEILFNIIITIIIYPLMQKTGELLEEIFKKKRNNDKVFLGGKVI